MSKRRLENEIDEVSDEVLGDLSPDERLQLVLESRAEDNKEEVDQLMRTCPRHKTRVRDREFANRLRFSQRRAHQAIYELHTTYLQYKLAVLGQRDQWLLDKECEPDTEHDRASGKIRTIRTLLVQLYTKYHAYRRFTTEVLDIDLETWVVVHPKGSIVTDAVASVIDDEERVERANAQRVPDGESMTLDDIVEVRYETLRSAWADEFGE